jgi:hypothetical protein
MLRWGLAFYAFKCHPEPRPHLKDSQKQRPRPRSLTFVPLQWMAEPINGVWKKIPFYSLAFVFVLISSPQHLSQ